MVPEPGVTVAESLALVVPLPSTMDWMEPRVTKSVMTSPLEPSSRNTKYHTSTTSAMAMAATMRIPAIVLPRPLRFFFGPVGAAGGRGRRGHHWGLLFGHVCSSLKIGDWIAFTIVPQAAGLGITKQ